MFHIYLNILACSVFLKQIKAALRAIRNMDNLPIIRMHDGSKDKSANDILEWLALAFGFQVIWISLIFFIQSNMIDSLKFKCPKAHLLKTNKNDTATNRAISFYLWCFVLKMFLLTYFLFPDLCGVKKGNVANQREHLVLLLANMDVRNKTLQDHENYDQVIDFFSNSLVHH